MSPSSPSATGMATPENTPQEPSLDQVRDLVAKGLSPESTETTAGTQPESNEPWHEKIMKDELVKGVAFNWFQNLTQRMATVEEKIKENKDRDDATKNMAKDAQTLKRLPEVRDCNWEMFKNRYGLGNGIPVIETLLAGHDLDREMEEEQLRRLAPDKRRDFVFDNKKKGSKRSQTGKTTDTQRVERVRINSPAVLSLLSEVTGQVLEVDKPLTFLRPFKTLIRFQNQMEKESGKLEKSFPNVEVSPKLSAQDEPSDQKQEEGLERAVTQTPSPESDSGKQVYLEILCYLDFVRNRILPDYQKFDGLSEGRVTKVQFGDLWSLFRMGDLIFESADDKSNRMNANKMPERGIMASQPPGRRVWKVFDIITEETSWIVDSLDAPGGTLRRNREEEAPRSHFSIWGYRIDHDGDKYVGAPKGFVVMPFDGEINVTRLSVYPARFQKGSREIIKNLQTRGRNFQQLMDHQHSSIQYEGWTLLHDPSGAPLPDPDNSTSNVLSQYISSDVIIDFEEAYQRHPPWKPVMYQVKGSPWTPVSKHDFFPIIQWTGKNRSHELLRITEVVVEDDNINELDWSKFIETDNYIADPDARAEVPGVINDPEGEITKQNLTDEDLALLPPRLFVYSLRDRKFINGDIRCLKLQRPEDLTDPFLELKIPEQDKELIRSMVVDHFAKKKIQRHLQSKGQDSYEQDFIPGKGQGLVILLHGSPGVGKTATAEAVAYTHKKPLFPITCGDLGTNPQTVERTLSDLFRLANLWDCVLLLDEAEVFLSRREKMDDSLQRNALVSIFLRTLEYYPGILFLTTNRVGVLDEALNSRVHISIYFNNLNLLQTLALFEMNIRRCRVIAQQRAAVTKDPVLQIKEEEITNFAMQQYEAHVRSNTSGPWWNGRQIRNAFQIATSLAYETGTTNDSQAGSAQQKCLGSKHFEQILRAINDYATYRIGVHRKNEEELAYERAERTWRPARATPVRFASRQYEAQQEMASTGGPAPYRMPQQQHNRMTPNPSPMSVPDRSRETNMYGVQSNTGAYVSNLGSQPRAESSFSRSEYLPSTNDGVPPHLYPPGSADGQVFGGGPQYYQVQQ